MYGICYKVAFVKDSNFSRIQLVATDAPVPTATPNTRTTASVSTKTNAANLLAVRQTAKTHWEATGALVRTAISLTACYLFAYRPVAAASTARALSVVRLLAITVSAAAARPAISVSLRCEMVVLLLHSS